jgi:uncharacterized protein
MKPSAFFNLAACCAWALTSCRTSPPPENYLPLPKGAGGSRPLPPTPASGGAGGEQVGLGGDVTQPGGEGGEWLPSSGGAPGSGAGTNGSTGGRENPPASGGVSSSSGGSAPTGGSTSVECPLPSSTSQFSRENLRRAAAACVSWATCEFEVASRALPQEMDVDSIDSVRAKKAWKEAMIRWSWLESMQFGPTATPSEVQGRDTYQGRGLRDLIYAWPQVSRCRVDEQVAGKRYELFGMQVVPISGRGLYGLESLLYYEGVDTLCTPTSTTGELWPTLSAEQIGELRHAYRRALSRDVREQALALAEVWSPKGENFGSKFAQAEGYPSEQEAMNVLGWALLYLEREVKDYKLGIPAGYTVGAPVTEAEASYSGIETELLRANVAGFRAIFQGCSPGNSGLGFDDWLVEAGHPELSADILEATEALETRLGTLPEFRSWTLAEIDEVYLATKKVTDFLKGDLFGAGSPINLKLPAGLEGDTD